MSAPVDVQAKAWPGADSGWVPVPHQGHAPLTVARAEAVAVAPRRVLSIEKLRRALLWLIGFAGAFVFIEPSPYEVIGVVAIAFFAVTGLVLRAAIAPLLMLLILLNIGYAIALVQVVDQPKLVIWVLVSVFLAATAAFYAAVLGVHAQDRLDRLLRGYLAGALVALSSPSRPTSICSAAPQTCSCYTAARAARSTIRTCWARSWCCPGWSFSSACWQDGCRACLAVGCSCW